ncbi:MAG: hypothetical protein QE265_09525 [Rhodoferax sp.]|nr:hypothetical protein [Rhodoferax sp.]
MAESPHINEVRSALLDTLRDLRNKENPMDIKRALAVAQVAGVLVESAKVENEYLKLTGQDQSKFLEIPPDPAVAHLGTTVQPGDRNGITSITRHRMGG